MKLYVNQSRNRATLKEDIYAGTIFLETQLRTAQKLCGFARERIAEAFGADADPRQVHLTMPVETFVSTVSKLKSGFTNSVETKELIREFVVELGEDPAHYLFDVPRLRVVPHYDYLHAGVSYAYKPHRDTWYGGVACQVNTWMPVYAITPDQTMMINAAYFDAPVRNSSADWQLKEWISTERWLASTNVKEETRPHPVPLEEIDATHETRIAPNAGEMLIFSGSHLHGTVPNRSGQTRFSIDFRLMHIADLAAGRGAINVDSGCADPQAGFKDYLHADTFKSFQGVEA
ncbi:hypothetical protein [Paraburkholderia solisilvae]|uniref:Fe2OG dioxygenase domain-containing protein n=1 Tax=Paraburkholderia solisilvae TaxID=624376 RepID=A0A6J5ERP1_9BURK|nr:hypothetical protein [Paraburkholderia solisilvae]CAB3768091.1 hypothetical protein LMG29739_05231 [Paraburkholderia solisilvae]